VPFLCQAARRYGDTFTMQLLRSGPIVVTSDPDTIRQIFTGSGQVLHAGAAGAFVLAPLVGNHSVLVLDGPEHLRQRKLLLPPFHGARMKAYAEIMRDTTTRVCREWPTDAAFELHSFMQQITLEVILHTVFGVDDAARMKALGDRLTTILDIGTRPGLAAILLPDFVYGPSSRLMAERRLADALIYDELERRRAAGDAATRTDIMSLLLAAVDEDGQSMTNEELRDELVTLLVAGHETTATSLAWAFERILSSQRVYDRLRTEVRDVVGSGPMTDDHVGKLVYLDAVVKETLRLRPIVPMVVRRLAVPMSLRGFELPAGAIVAPSIYLTHRRADLYPNPDQFRPERFLVAEGGARPDPYAWLPFGGGIRRCIGMAFAQYEMKVVLATVLAEHDLMLAPDSSARMARRGITFAPSDGARVTHRPHAVA
jgi:cytochrome P450